MSPGARAYSSPLRAEQAAQTRDRIIDAAVDLLQDGDSAPVGMQEVADRAGVSVRTVYRAFPTKEDLLEGVRDTIEARFAGRAGPFPEHAAGYLGSTDAAVRAVYELEPLYRALLATAAGRASHRRGAADRLAILERTLAPELEGLPEDARRRFAGVFYLMSSSRSVLLLKDYTGLDADDASAAVQWALSVLIDAVSDPDQRARL